MDIIINPFATLLLLFYSLLGENVFFAIVGFTVTVRTLLMPLTLYQQRSLKSMQEIQPKVKELQELYGDDREVFAQKQIELYREHNVNPVAGCLPMLIQLPIIFGLWRAILATLATTPGQMLELYDRILWRDAVETIFGLSLDNLVPMDSHFLWLNLGVPDPYLVLPVLVVITTWVQQKLLTPSMPKTKSSSGGNDPSDQAAQMTRQMTTIMPLMFGFFSISYSSGLSIYFVIANIIGIVQYSAMGRADFRRLIGREKPSDDYLLDLARNGRQRLDGVTDTAKSIAKFDGDSPRTNVARSQRVKQAKAKARRAKVDV